MKPSDSGATLSEILGVVQPESVSGLKQTSIASVACHPDEVKGSHCLFVCINEYLEYNKWQTWRSHLETLAELDLAAVVTPEIIPGLEIPQLVCKDPRRALGQIARLLNGYPDLYIPVFGVTGTNGKTTTTRLLAHLFSSLGKPCGSIGTLGIELAGKFELPGTYTTPLAPQLYSQLKHLREAGADRIAMEVSSHGLALDRVEGIAFEGAILTNVERDHLDFHGTQAAYAEAKRQLFTMVRQSGLCVLNKDSAYCQPFAETASARVVTYGKSGSGADYELIDMELLPTRSRFSLHHEGHAHAFETQLVGEFQIENAMAAIALLVGTGFPIAAVADALRGFPSVCGRMEQFLLPSGATAIVDYAHNPDGLKHLLESSRLLCKGRLHVVFGCGGDRDRGKRPIMGQLASRIADVCWITSDNPRTEDPHGILRDILDGCERDEAVIIEEPDRKTAIEKASADAGPEDVVVVAGKGHEDYQLIGFTKHPFSDQGVLRGLGAC